MSSKRETGSASAALWTCGRSALRAGLGALSAALRAGRGPVIGALALFVLASCLLEGDKSAKRGSEVENEIHGVLVALDGDPVQGAKVKAVPVSGQIAKRGGAAADSDSVVTDEDGKYSLQGLQPGTYNLFGDYESGNLVVMIPGVDHRDTSEPKDQGVDTLRAPGRIRGRLLLGDQGKGGVLAYVPGTSYMAVSDDSGWFLISGVPQGRHGVRYSAAGYIIDPDTGVTVISGKTAELPAKRLAHDPALPPPAPTGLTAVYDTLNECVILSWDPVPVADLDGYVVYKDKPSFLDPQAVSGGFTKETTFVDPSPGIPLSGGKESLVYRVKSRDREVNLSINYSIPAEVTVVGRDWVTTAIQIRSDGARTGTLSIGDSARLIAAYSNPTRANRKFTWFVNGLPASTRTEPDPTLSGTDTLHWKQERPGNYRFVLEIEDEAGSRWTAEHELNVVLDSPVVSAGRDTAVSIGDRVELRGSGRDGFGHIVKWEWAIGDQDFAAGPDGETGFVAPRLASDSVFPCILQVTDDDGLVSRDTVLVHVLLDPPAADAGADLRASIGDSLKIRGAGSDRFGDIVSWEWDVGGNGVFVSSGPDLPILLPAVPTTELPIVLRIRDDDGWEDRDTVLVQVLRDAPVASAAYTGQALFAGDTVKVTSAASRDGFGSIVRVEWDPGLNGTFLPSGADTSIVLPGTGGVFRIGLKVTDDDGQSGFDTLALDAHERGGRAWIDAGAIVDATTSSVYAMRLLEFKDKLWSIGGRTSPHSTLHTTDGKRWEGEPSPFDELGRTSHTAVVFKDRIWVLGGFALTQRRADIWSTADGLAWTLNTDSAAFGSRSSHATVVFKDRLWVFGGGRGDRTPERDIWSSADGVRWEMVPATAPWEAGRGVVAVVHAGKIFASVELQTGGEPAPAAIWSSEDGITWTQILAATPFPHPDASSIVSHEGRIWIPNGRDIWSSPDGVTWTRNPQALPKSYSWSGFSTFKGMMWLLGADDGSKDVIFSK